MDLSRRAVGDEPMQPWQASKSHSLRRMSRVMKAIVVAGLGVLAGALFSLPALAQSTLPLDAYLHGSGATTNPPTLTVDLFPSISLTAKTKDSPAVNFSGGNPWQVIGNWTPPTGSTGSFTITAVGPSHLWTGVKASGDVGGKIDLQTDVLVNGAVISTGLTRCISNLTASSSTPVDVSVALGAIPVTPINAATHTLAIRVSARMGTNTNGTACGTKSSVTGVRLYFDSLFRLSRLGVTIQTPPPTPVALIPNPLSIKTGTTASLTAILFPISLQTSTLTLTSSSPSIVTVPGSIAVAPGQIFVSIPVTGVSAGTAQITAVMNGKSATSTVRVTGGVATVTSLTPPALSITQGGSGTLTVTLNAVQSTNTTVALASSTASVASVPANVNVPAGQLTAPVTVAANTVGQADITASLNGTSATSHITVTPSLPTVVALQPSTSQVVIGASSTLTVTISSAQTTNTTVTLTTNPNGFVSVPATVIVPANQTQATFAVSGVTLGTAMVTASLNATSATASVDVVPPAVQLADLQPPTQSLVIDATGQLTVTLNAQQTTLTTIALLTDQPAVLELPASVTVQPNQITAPFVVIGRAPGAATITATLGSVTKTATVLVTPLPPQVTEVIPATLNVVQGATGQLTVRINAAQPTDTIVPLTNSSVAILDVPAAVTVPAGLTEAPIQVTGLAFGTATVTATLNGTVTSTITVVAPPVLLTALAPAPPAQPPLTVAKGRSGVLRVTINRVPVDPTIITLTNASTNLVTVPSTVTVQAGALFADFPVTTQNEGTATITATLNSSTQSAQVVVTAAEVDAISLVPANATAVVGEGLAYSATGTYTDGSTQPIAGGLTWTSTNPTVAEISPSGFVTTLSPGSTTIRATMTTSVGPVSGDTTLTVQAAPVLSLAPATANLIVGQAVTLTVTSAAPAPTGGLTVTFSLAGSGTVTLNPLTVLISQGQVSGTVQATGTLAGTVTVTATAPLRAPGTSTLTIANPVPTLAMINPTQIIAGGAPVTLTVTGTNFVTTSVVNLDGAPLTTTFVSATQLTAIIPAAAMASPHVGSVTITNPAPGGGTSGALPLTIVSPVSLITTISPSQVLTGSAAFTLSITGSNFVGTSTVQLDGLNLVTGFVSATQLTAQVPVTALAVARAVPVTVVTPPPGGGTSNSVLLIINTPPIANAGRPQSATVGASVTLDGRNSVDADRDPLSFSWVFASKPVGSAVTLLNPTAVRPSFVPDVAGIYQIELNVNDGNVLSTPAVVTVTAATPNAPANAEPGSDHAALVGQPVTLDGRLSTDPDNAQLRYTWTIVSAPGGSAATLTNNTSVLASLTPDLPGDYIITLIVNDGTQDSAPVAIKITATSGNAAPIALAGRDRNVLANSLVTLDGSGSRDPNPGTTLTYSWSFASVPAGSTATLTNPTAVAPSFTPTVTGDYLVRLVVNDGVVDSAPSVVLIKVATPNAGPNANAGGDQSVAQTERVTLNGSASSDPNGDALTYQWSLLSVPTGSTAVLSSQTAAQPTFVADLAGFYAVRLFVSDGTNLSTPEIVVIKAQAVTALAVMPVNPSIGIGQTQPFVATATLTDNSTQVLTNSVTWASSTPAVATINPSGLAASVAPGTTVITAAAGTITSPAQTLTVLPAAPTIGTITPATGTIGTIVTITGTNLLGSGPGTTTVRFNNATAIITAVTATNLTTTVPQGATTGLVTITTPGGTAIGAQPFTVTTSQDFSLAAAPGQVTVVRGQPTTAQIQATNGGTNPVTGFISLAATGLPTGMSGSFTPTQIAGGQVATLTLNSGTAPTGLATITISATAVIDGQTIVRQSPLQVNVLAAGTTTLSGRILATKDDTPIPGSRVSIGALVVNTDASGNFLFTNPPTGQQVLLISGPTDLYPGSLPVQTTIQAGQANILPYPVFMHEVGQNYFPIAQGGQTIVAPPDIPGFSMMIPAGTTITGWDGQPNLKVSVVPVPIDRLPIPTLPPNIPAKQVYMFNFGKPGGGYPSRPIPIIMPNDYGAPPGTRMDMWYYDEGPTPDPTSHQWKIYGQGTVSADGTSVIPDPGVGQPKFCCGGGTTAPGIIARLSAAALRLFNTALTALDPVLLQTGMFALDQTDMVLPGRMPIVIRRAYHSQDPGDPINEQPPARELVNSNAFGFNTTLMEYDDRLQGDGSGQTLTYTSGFDRERLSRQGDGTYRTDRIPMLAGWVGRRNQDGTATLQDKNGTVRTFGSDGWIRIITDRNGNTVTIVRSGAQIQQIIEPGGRALTFQYSGGAISQITDPLGRTVRYTYEASPPPFGQAQLHSVENPAGGITTYTYDGRFNLLTITDARGITYLTNTYVTTNEPGRRPLDPAVETQTLADGSISRIDYVVTNQTITQATVTDGRGNKSVHRFNSFGHEVVAVDALGQQTRLTRDFVTNRVSEARDPLNRVTKYTYDVSGNVTSVIDPQGNPTIFEYDPTFNRVTKITDALNQITRFTYDLANGNLLSVIDPLTHTTTMTYNAFGQPIGVTDPLGQSSTLEYDTVGNLIATTDPVGNKTQQIYDTVSRLTALIDPRGKTTQFTYDPVNQVTQLTDALNGLTTFTYDPNGNLLTLTDAKNHTTTYTYDNMDRLQTRPDALNRSESYQYDLAGNLTRFTDRKNQQSNFVYDALNRRTNVSYADGTSVTAAYDAVGNVTKLTDSTTGAIDWTYDVLDRVTQEVTPQGIIRYTYDALSRRLSLRANAQQSVSYSYDANSQLSQVAQGTLSAVLTHDALGRRTQLQRSNGVTTTYAYDTASRITGLTHAKGATVIEQLSLGFDQTDNKTQVTQVINAATALPPAVTAAYDAVNQQAQFAGTTLANDNNGNLTTDGTNTYVWDARDRLIGISGGTSATFTYDALDRRIVKAINGAISTYLYDDADIVIETGATNATYLSTLNIDEPLVRQTSTGNEYYHTDDLGSTLVLTNDSGAVTTTYTYEPFGSTTVTGASTNPFQFTGRENDGNGLYYYRARYYSPSRSRFLSEDPLGFDAGDPNLYAYVSNNPTNFTDPDGEIRLPPAVKQCLAGLIKSLAKKVGINIVGRKPDAGGDPLDPLDAAQACVGGGGGSNKHNAAPRASNASTNPAAKTPNFVVDPKGNAIPLQPGQTVTSSPDAKWIQVRDASGNPTGTRLDGGHKPTTHPDPRAQVPHAHVPGVTNPDGTPWLPVRK